MNYELNLKLANLLDKEIKDTNWIFKSIVVTRYDTTILGSFAKIVGKTNICYLTEYSFFRDSTKKKELKIIKEDSSTCKSIIDSIFSTTNSTKFFNLKKEKN